jgi:hypothetical protein
MTYQLPNPTADQTSSTGRGDRLAGAATAQVFGLAFALAIAISACASATTRTDAGSTTPTAGATRPLRPLSRRPRMTPWRRHCRAPRRSRRTRRRPRSSLPHSKPSTSRTPIGGRARSWSIARTTQPTRPCSTPGRTGEVQPRSGHAGRDPERPDAMIRSGSEGSSAEIIRKGPDRSRRTRARRHGHRAALPPPLGLGRPDDRLAGSRLPRSGPWDAGPAPIGSIHPGGAGQRPGRGRHRAGRRRLPRFGEPDRRSARPRLCGHLGVDVASRAMVAGRDGRGGPGTHDGAGRAPPACARPPARDGPPSRRDQASRRRR